MEIVPNLHFNGNCKKAIELYEQAFGAKRTVFLRYKDANPQDMHQETSHKIKELVYHAELMIANRRIFLNDHISNIPSGINLSLLILFDNVEQVKTAYEILKKNARILTPITETTYSNCFVSLIDQFGIRWELMKEN